MSGGLYPICVGRIHVVPPRLMSIRSPYFILFNYSFTILTSVSVYFNTVEHSIYIDIGNYIEVLQQIIIMRGE